MELKEFQASVAASIFGKSKEDAIKKDTCIDCKQEALPNCYSDAGRREYYISGLCEKCFDKIFGGKYAKTIYSEKMEERCS
uniref:Uncharacterized protein n=1 Tax=viral metagenome TaxID=1070528 RepID=A0A6M3K8L7_9ZZZZ